MTKYPVVIVPEDWGHMVPEKFMENIVVYDASSMRIGDPLAGFESVGDILKWWANADQQERVDGFDDVLNALQVWIGGAWRLLMWSNGAIIGIDVDDEWCEEHDTWRSMCSGEHGV